MTVHTSQMVWASSLVVGETGWVTILNPVVHKANAFATVGFVAHRPPDDGGMILVAFDGALNAVK